MQSSHTSDIFLPQKNTSMQLNEETHNHQPTKYSNTAYMPFRLELFLLFTIALFSIFPYIRTHEESYIKLDLSYHNSVLNVRYILNIISVMYLMHAIIFNVSHL